MGRDDVPRGAGYDAIVRDLMATVDKVRAGVAAIGGIDVVGEPIGPVLAFRSDTRRSRGRR